MLVGLRYGFFSMYFIRELTVTYYNEIWVSKVPPQILIVYEIIEWTNAWYIVLKIFISNICLSILNILKNFLTILVICSIWYFQFSLLS